MRCRFGVEVTKDQIKDKKSNVQVKYKAFLAEIRKGATRTGGASDATAEWLPPADDDCDDAVSGGGGGARKAAILRRLEAKGRRKEGDSDMGEGPLLNAYRARREDELTMRSYQKAVKKW
jgi:hypothetical protein